VTGRDLRQPQWTKREPRRAGGGGGSHGGGNSHDKQPAKSDPKPKTKSDKDKKKRKVVPMDTKVVLTAPTQILSSAT